jgi:hypothetical protein
MDMLDWRSLSTRKLANDAEAIRDAAVRLADGLRGTGPDAGADPAELRLALGFFGRLLEVLAADAEEVGAAETNSKIRRTVLDVSALAALGALAEKGGDAKALPLPGHQLRHARHAVREHQQLAVGFSGATADNIKAVLEARDAVLALTEEFGIELPKMVENQE